MVQNETNSLESVQYKKDGILTIESFHHSRQASKIITRPAYKPSDYSKPEFPNDGNQEIESYRLQYRCSDEETLFYRIKSLDFWGNADLYVNRFAYRSILNITTYPGQKESQTRSVQGHMQHSNPQWMNTLSKNIDINIISETRSIESFGFEININCMIGTMVTGNKFITGYESTESSVSSFSAHRMTDI